ncbi:MAG: hypothetical protein HY906_08520 [Deltaproteobacteria bacterium]|nr:hypothetical protein [Deltaproteobacteria bacterium]
MRLVTRRLAALLASLAILAVPVMVWAAGGEKVTPLENVADTRDLGPGLVKFLADTYNGNLWLFGLYVVVLMAGMGAVLGLGVDKLIGLTGIGLGKMDHHE